MFDILKTSICQFSQPPKHYPHPPEEVPLPPQCHPHPRQKPPRLHETPHRGGRNLRRLPLLRLTPRGRLPLHLHRRIQVPPGLVPSGARAIVGGYGGCVHGRRKANYSPVLWSMWGISCCRWLWTEWPLGSRSLKINLLLKSCPPSDINCKTVLLNNWNQ